VQEHADEREEHDQTPDVELELVEVEGVRSGGDEEPAQ